MTESHFERLQRIFDEVLEQPREAQEAYLAALLPEEPALRAEIWALVEREHRDGGWLTGRVSAALPALAAAALPQHETLTQVGPYTLHEVIGVGGMGRVFRATRSHEGIEQEVALKLVRGEMINLALIKRFSTERRLLAALSHPGICRFLDAGTHRDGSPYVVMELVRGVPLLRHCEEARLDLPARLRLLRRIAAAVAHAHAHLVVHRDIKVENVLVDDHGQPKLLDFGIAKSLQESGQTATAERYLTPSSAAPEQLRGEEVSVGCDIYALGALAYQLLCGHPPFEFQGLRAAEVERLVLLVPPPLMSQRLRSTSGRNSMSSVLIDGLRGDLDTVIAKCLRKDPAERYESVRQFDEDLARIEAHQAISVRADDRWYRMRKFVRRHRAATAFSVTLLGTILGALVTVLLQSREVERQRIEALKERDTARAALSIMKDAFAAADPAGELGADVRARDILAAARPSVEALRDEEPRIHAELASTLSEVHLSLNQDREASELASAAALTAEAVGDKRLLRTAWMVQAQADAVLDRDESTQELLDRVLALDGQDSVDRRVVLGRFLARSDRFDEAIAVLEAVLTDMQERSPRDPVAIEARRALIWAYRRNGQLEEGLRANEGMLQWQREALAANHPMVLATQVQRVQLLRLKGEFDAAIELAEQTRKEIIAIKAADSSLMAAASSALGLAMYARGDVQASLAPYREAIAIWARVRGEEHPETARAEFNLAVMMSFVTGQEDAADWQFRRAIASNVAYAGPHGDTITSMRVNHAAFLQRVQRVAAAVEVLSSTDARIGLSQASPQTRARFLELAESLTEAPECRERAAQGACMDLAKALRDDESTTPSRPSL